MSKTADLRDDVLGAFPKDQAVGRTAPEIAAELGTSWVPVAGAMQFLVGEQKLAISGQREGFSIFWRVWRAQG